MNQPIGKSIYFGFLYPKRFFLKVKKNIIERETIMLKQIQIHD